MTTPSPTPRPDELDEPAPRPTPTPLADDLATLTALTAAVGDRELPELIGRTYDADGIHAIPYLPMRPITALAAWMDVIPGMTVQARQAPAYSGTEVTATGTVAGRGIALTVTTWRVVRGDESGRVTATTLARLVGAESTGDPTVDDAPTVDVDPNTVPAPLPQRAPATATR